MTADDREPLGRIAFGAHVSGLAEQEQPPWQDKPPVWEELGDGDREFYMRIGSAVAAQALAGYEAERNELTLARLSRSVKLARIAALCRAKPDRVCAEDVLRIIVEEEASLPRVTVDLNVRVRKHETYSGFDDVTGADPAALRWGDRVAVVEAESGICSGAIVTGMDAERRLVYLAPDWHGWRDTPEEP